MAKKIKKNGKPAAPEPSKPLNIPQPEEVKTQSTRFELEDTSAGQVYIAGSFNNWQPGRTPLVAKGNGRWLGDLQLPRGRHEYLFVVDGRWITDPKASETVANPFGGLNSVVTISK